MGQGVGGDIGTTGSLGTGIFLIGGCRRKKYVALNPVSGAGNLPDTVSIRDCAGHFAEDGTSEGMRATAFPSVAGFDSLGGGSRVPGGTGLLPGASSCVLGRGNRRVSGGGVGNFSGYFFRIRQFSF